VTVLASRPPSEYQILTTKMSLSELLIYLEQRRVWTAWNDLTDE
jgi:hypothetical protein